MGAEHTSPRTAKAAAIRRSDDTVLVVGAATSAADPARSSHVLVEHATAEAMS